MEKIYFTIIILLSVLTSHAMTRQEIMQEIVELATKNKELNESVSHITAISSEQAKNRIKCNRITLSILCHRLRRDSGLKYEWLSTNTIVTLVLQNHLLKK